MMSTGAAAAAASFAGSRRRGVGCNSSCFMAGGDKTVKHLSVRLKRQQQQQQRRGRDGGVVVYAAKGRNARLAGRDRKAQQREDDKMLDGRDAADEKREAKAQEKVKREPGVKYSKRGKVSSQPGQVSKAALKRIREVRKGRGKREEGRGKREGSCIRIQHRACSFVIGKLRTRRMYVSFFL